MTQSQQQAPVPKSNATQSEAGMDRGSPVKRQLRGMSYDEGARALAPVESEAVEVTRSRGGDMVGYGVTIEGHEQSDEGASGTTRETVSEESFEVGLKGVKVGESETTSETTLDGTATTKRSGSAELTRDGLGHEASSSVTHADGSGRSESTKGSLSTEKASRSQTVTTNNSDGSSTSTSSGLEATRGDGRAGLESSSSRSDKDAAGNTSTVTSVTGGGLIAGEDGLGAYGKAERGYERESKSGLKTGAVAGLNGNVVCNVEAIEGSAPKQYRLVLSVALGGEGALSAEKRGVSGGVSASGSVVMSSSKVLGEAEALSYLEALRGASAGGSGDGSREMAIIQTGVTKGWEAARQLYEGAKGGVTDAATLARMKDGDKQSISKSGEVGGKVGAGGESGGTSVGASVNYGVGSDSSVTVEKKDGKFVFETSAGEHETLGGGATLGVGAVSGGMSASRTERAATGYKIVLDPRVEGFEAKRAALAACESQADFDNFAKQYPDTIEGKTTSQGKTDKLGGKVGLAGASVGLNYDASLDESVETDAEGELVKKTVDGSNTGGVKVSALGFEVGASSKESANASIDKEGNASVDVSQTDKETNPLKWLEANVPGVGEKKEASGTLSAITKGDKKPEVDDTRVAGIKLDNADLDGLAAKAMDPNKWSAACPNPRLRPDWMAAGARIRAAGGDRSVVATELAKFVGKGGHGRDEVIGAAVRSAGDVSGGDRYEFPEGLGGLKATYESLVIADPVAAIDKIGGDLAAVEKLEAAMALKDKLETLYAQVASASNKFESPAVHGEMLAKIGQRKGEVQAKLRVLRGGKADEMSVEEARAQYNLHLDNCVRFQQTEGAVFAEMEETWKNQHTSLNESIDNAKGLKQLRDLYATWSPEYDKLAELAQEHGFGKDRYWRFKPDRARFERALVGAPGPASEAKPETEDKRKKAAAPVAPKDPIGDAHKQNEANRQAQANAIASRVSPSKNKAWGAGNKLHAWLQSQPNGKGLDAHGRGMTMLKRADANANKLPKNATELDWETFGLFAVQDYEQAAQLFGEGLALYPQGWPAKGA